MKTRNKTFKIILLIFLSLLFLFLALLSVFLITYNIDKQRATNNQEPMFILNKTALNDGGTQFYFGIGYQIIKWKIMADEPGWYYMGTEYHTLFNLRSIDELCAEGPLIELEYTEIKCENSQENGK